MSALRGRTGSNLVLETVGLSTLRTRAVPVHVQANDLARRNERTALGAFVAQFGDGRKFRTACHITSLQKRSA